MRRLARRLFTLCSAASLLLFLAVCALWVRSHHTHDDVQWIWWRSEQKWPQWVRAASGGPRIYSAAGGLEFTVGYIERKVSPEALATEQREPTLSWNRGWMPPDKYPPVETISGVRPLGGFALCAYEAEFWNRQGDVWGWTVILPYWFLAAASGGAPARWVVHAVRAKRRDPRRRSSLCLRCGYDLRATPGRCPECGAAAAADSAR